MTFLIIYFWSWFWNEFWTNTSNEISRKLENDEKIIYEEFLKIDGYLKEYDGDIDIIKK